MLISDTKSQTQETQRTPSRINTKKPVPGYIIFKQQKIKDEEKALKEAREGGDINYPYRRKEQNSIGPLFINHATKRVEAYI